MKFLNKKIKIKKISTYITTYNTMFKLRDDGKRLNDSDVTKQQLRAPH